jgi:hypothetical protein
MFSARRALRPHVEAILDHYDDEQLVPTMRTDGVAGPLLACEDVYHPPQASASQLLSVVHLDLTGTSPVTATGIYADGWTVYASAENLYVASSGGVDWWWRGADVTTRIHRFALGALGSQGADYTGTASAPGWLLGRYAMDEEAGILRVATTEYDEAMGSSSAVFTFGDGPEGLVRLGEVRGIAPGEAMYAARFLGD